MSTLFSYLFWGYIMAYGIIIAFVITIVINDFFSDGYSDPTIDSQSILRLLNPFGILIWLIKIIKNGKKEL